MFTVRTIHSLRDHLHPWRRTGERIALVPTMGNLHSGHLALVRRAGEIADRVVVSIFVNPTQFGVGEDYSTYPRTLDEDIRLLLGENTDLLFTPDVGLLYPDGTDQGTWVEVPGLSGILCGRSRPSHFRGVTTVVAKLFNCIQPDVALFGEKDYQQLQIIRKMTRDLCIPVEIVGVPTVRESDGLALSSRNSYLTLAQRRIAPQLYRILQRCREQITTGEYDFEAVASEARRELQAVGFRPDYVEIRCANSLAPPTPDEEQLVVLAAAYLGRTRLIDNIIFSSK